MKTKTKDDSSKIPPWTFLSNHAHVLLCLAKDPEVRLRDMAVMVGITERAVNRIISELEDAGYVSRSKIGRRNHYEIESDMRLRHPLEAHSSIRILLAIVLSTPTKRR